MTRGTGRTPPGRSQSTSTIQSETVATRRAAMPDGTVFSAQETVPLPTARSRQPTMKAVRHCAKVGFSRVAHRIAG